jgi:multidrug efflux pump subunit AcrA (membrane-fusion protein)
VTSPHDGRVSEWLVEPGEWVEAGTAVARLELEDLQQQKSELEASLAALEHRRQRAVQKAQAPRARRLHAALQKKEAELERLAAARERVPPNAGRGLALAIISLPPQRNVFQPKHTQEGLEFDLGDANEVDGRPARLTVRVSEGGENEVLELML